MKIAHLTTHLNMGGAPIYILTLSRALKQLNVDQIVISSGGSMESDFEKSDIKTFRFNLQTKFEFHPKLFAALGALIRVLKQEKIDLIHTHTRVGQVLAAWIQWKTGIPFVSTCHGFFKPRLGRRIFPAWGKKVIAISEPVQRHLIERHHIPQNKIVWIRNGIEIERFTQATTLAEREIARKRFNLNPSHFAVCMVSRMIFEKGPEDLLEAIALLHAKYPQLRAFLVGDGPDKAELELLAKNRGISHCVQFTGNLMHVEKILAACDAFVHPVRVPEGFGLSIAEAMASGLPILVTNLWALSSLIKDNDVGELIENENPAQMADVLSRWMENSELICARGKNAAKIAQEMFDIRRTAQQVFDLYSQVFGVKQDKSV